MQWGALRRFWGAVRRSSGWKPGEVAFGVNHEPIPVNHMDLHAFRHSAMHDYVDRPTDDGVSAG